MRRALWILLGVLAVAGLATAGVLLFRGDGDKSADEPILVTQPASQSHTYGVSVGTPERIARLPGITVLGSGEVEVRPDTALVRLTVGSGSGFESGDSSVRLVDEAQIEPVVDALQDEGVPDDDIYVNTLSGSSFGQDEQAAVILFKWPRPREVKEVLATAQREIRNETPFNLQGVSVVFVREDCGDAEERALRKAVADARERAEQLAALADVELGRLVAVSDAAASSPYAALASPRCGLEDVLAGIPFEYQAANTTADDVPVSATLEATFAVER